ncbi:MAG: thioesterase family protein [Flavobacteriales bacterium]
MSRRLSVPVQVRFADVDMARHVHNAVYLHWFETGRMALLREVTPPVNDWRTEGLILARNEVDHRRPVHLTDDVSVEVWCGAIGNKSFDLHYVVRRLKDGAHEVCAEGRSVMVCFNYVTDQAIPIPGAWRMALERFVEE